jgi:hypothetical protein
MKSHDPNECRVQAAKCIRKTSLCIEVKARDALYKMAKEWLELAVRIERAHARQDGSRLAALADVLDRQPHSGEISPLTEARHCGRHGEVQGRVYRLAPGRAADR